MSGGRLTVRQEAQSSEQLNAGRGLDGICDWRAPVHAKRPDLRDGTQSICQRRSKHSPHIEPVSVPGWTAIPDKSLAIAHG